MKYTKYKTLISYLAKIIAFIKRYRIIILSTFLGIVAVTSTLLGLNGTVINETDVPPQIVYGEEISFEATSFMSDTKYQYYDYEQQVWLYGLPTDPGSYKIRAYSKTVFNQIRYGKEHPVTILPKQVIFVVDESEIRYGDTPTAKVKDTYKLAYHDNFTCSEFEFYDLDKDQVQVSPLVSGIKITRTFNGKTTDVTKFYEIFVEKTDIDLTVRKVAIKVEDNEKVYDGIELTSDLYTITEGEFVEGDKVSFEFDGNILDCGTTTNNASLKSVINEDGVDVTKYYEVESSEGNLTVTKRPLVINTQSISKVYDGTPLVFDSYAIDENTPLAQNQTIEYAQKAQRIDFGQTEIQKDTVYFIYDQNNKEVQSNYDISFAGDGRIDIYKRDVSIESATASREYDGTPFTAHTYSITSGSIVEGEKIDANYFGSVTEVRENEVNNFFTVKILKADNTDSSDNYNISIVYGKLSVYKRKINVNTHTLSWVYNGEDHVDDIEYQNSDLAADEGLFDIVDGQTAKTVKTTTIKYVNTEIVENVVEIEIYEEDRNVTENYEISYTYGTLSVTKRPIEITSHDLSWMYNGVEHYDGEVGTDGYDNDDLREVEGELYLLVDGHELKMTSNTGIKYVVESGKENKVAFIIFENNEDVTANYDISYVYGTLTITARPVEITTHDREWMYDGAEHRDGDTDTEGYSNEDLTDNADEGWYLLVNDQTLEITSNTPIKYVSESGKENVLTFAIFEGEEDVTENYAISYVYGTLTIHKRPIKIKTHDVKWVYDDTFHHDGEEDGCTYDNKDLREEENAFYLLVDGQTLSMTSFTEIRDYVEEGVENVLTFDVFEGEENVTDNYEIAYENGTLTIIKRAIEITTHDIDWLYDDIFHRDGEEDTKGYDNNDLREVEDELYLLVDGHTLEINTYTEIRDYIEDGKANALTFNVYKGGEDVTYNYDISYVYGTLTITKRSIEITTHDLSWIYNGQDRYDGEEGTVGYDNNDLREEADKLYLLVNGHTLEIETYTSIKYVVESGKANELTFNVYKGGEDVTENYEITYVYGTLTITVRSIEITTHDLSWIYDGAEHRDGDADTKGYSNEDLTDNEEEGLFLLVNDQTLEITSNTAIKYIVESGKENVVTFAIFEGEEDVTENYAISYVYGTLTITKRAIEITTHDLSWIYDGAEHRDGDADTAGYDNNDLREAEDELYLLVDGHTLEITSNTPIKYVIESGKANELTFAIFEGDEDVTENYEITYVYGTLTITVRPIEITTHDREWMYDGAEHRDESAYTNEDLTDNADEGMYLLVNDQTLVITSNTPIKYVSESGKENVLMFAIFEGEEEVTENYDITYVYGTLTIHKRPIKIKTHDVKWVYDDTFHHDGEEDGCTYDNKDLREEENAFYLLVDGQTLSMTSFTEIRDYVEEGVENALTFDVFEGEENVTDNYEIAYENGTLTIIKRAIEITTHDLSWIYDGAEHRDGDVDTVGYDNTDLREVEDELYLLVDGHTFEMTSNTPIKYVRESGKENVVTFNVLKNEEDVTYNYDITYVYGTLEIKKRSIEITTHDLSWIYDGAEHRDGDADTVGYDNTDLREVEDELYLLVDGHALEITSSTPIKYVRDTGKENVVTFAIFEGEEDVTENYDISYVYGTLEIRKRTIEITTHDLSWMYNGAEHHDGEAGTPGYDNNDLRQVEDELYLLVDGHILEIETYTSIKYVSESGKENVLTFRIYENEEDITENYAISYVYGTLTITARPIEITTHDREWMYDGAEHRDESVYTNEDLSDNEQEGWYLLVNDQTLEITSNTPIKYVAESGKENVLTFDIFEGEENVTDNYAISYVYGTLTITVRPIEITTHDREWMYDGAEHRDDSVYTNEDLTDNTEGGLYLLVNNQTLTITSSTPVKYVRDTGTKNVLTFDIFEGEENVTENYDISYVYGTLTITKRTIRIETRDREWMYDGAEHRDESVYTNENLSDNEQEGWFLLVNDQTLEMTSNTPIKYVSESGKANELTFIIFEGEEEVTENYDISYLNGTLTITKRTIRIETRDREWMYDGAEHRDESVYTNENLSDNEEEGWFLLVNDQTLEMTSNTPIKYVAESGKENELTFIIFEGEEEVTENYDISYLNGTLTITARPIEITTHDREWMYDGVEHRDDSVYTNEDLTDNAEEGWYLLVNNQTLEMTSNTPIKNVCETEKENVLTFDIFEGEENVTDNYAISYVYGTLTITVRPIEITTHDREWMYDGAEHRDDSVYTNEDLTDNEQEGWYLLVNNQTLTITSSTPIKNVCETEKENVLTFDIFEGEENVTENYAISYVYGTLTITVRPIEITTHDREWMYDGAEHRDDSVYTNEDLTDNEEGGLYLLVNNQTLTITSSTPIKYVSESEKENVLTFDIFEGEENVTDNYAISYVYGTLTITKRTIRIETRDREWMYDGAEHRDESVYTNENLTDNEEEGWFLLVNDQTLEMTSNTPIKYVAENGKANELTFIIFEGEEEVTENYDISYLNGTLTITKRTIKIETHDVEWVYDDEYHHDGEEDGCKYDNDSLVEEADKYFLLVDGHTLKMTSYTEVRDYVDGGVENVLTFDIFEGEEDVTENYAIDYKNGTLTIIKRAIEITTHDLSWMYNGVEHRDGEAGTLGYDNNDLREEKDKLYLLVNGHTLEIATSTPIKNVRESVKANELTFNVLKGNDSVTDNYAISYVYGTLTITVRPIEITTHSLSWIYDGKYHGDGDDDTAGYDNEDLREVAGIFYLLVEGHKIEVETNTTIKYVAESVKKNDVTFVIYDEVEDVTDNYDFTYVYGTLSITVRPIEITTHSLSWVYNDEIHYDGENGTPKYGYDDVIARDGYYDLPTNHELRIIKHTEVCDYVEGGVKNDLEFDVYENGTKVTENFKLSYVYGTLTITKRAIEITTHSLSWMYNGEAHRDGDSDTPGYDNNDLREVENELYLLVNGHTLEIVLSTPITNVSESGKENVVTFNVKKGDKDVTSNYAISYVNGTLEVYARPICIQTKDGEWTYDGNEHYDDRYDIIIDNVNSYPLVKGHNVSVIDSTVVLFATQNDGVDNVLTVKILVGEEDVTENYEINQQYGKLQILRRNVVIKTNGGTFLYDGTNHFDRNYSYEKNTPYEIVVGDEFKVEYSTIVNDVTDGTKNEFIRFVVKHGQSNATTSYDFDFIPGTFVVTPRLITIEAGSAIKTYDGTPLTHKEYTATLRSLDDGKPAIIKGHKFIYEMSEQSTITNVGSVANVIDQSTVKIENSMGKNLLGNYEIEYVNGTLTVEPRPITIKPINITKVYDGTPLTNVDNEVECSVGSLAVGDVAVATMEGSITNVGSIDYEINSLAIFRGDEDVTANYDIKYAKGTLTIEKRCVTVETATNKWFYDGHKHSDTSVIVYEKTNSDNGLAEGHTVQIAPTSSFIELLDVAKESNEFIVAIYSASEDVTSNYEIEYVYGTIEVMPRPIQVESYGRERMYDGTPLTHHEYKIISGVENEEAIVDTDYYEIVFTGTQTNKGTSPNTFDFIIYRTDTNKNVSSNYDVQVVCGELVVTARPITLTTATRHYLYSGYEYFDGSVKIGGEGLARYQYLKIDENKLPKIKNVGTIKNEFDIGITCELGERDYTDNYDITYIYGTLTVEAKSITITAKSAEKIYDGTPLTESGYDIRLSDGTDYPDGTLPIIEEQTEFVIIESALTDAGSIPNVISSVTIIDENEEDVTANYKITTIDGTLTVYKRYIKVAPEEVVVIYDGNVHKPTRYVLLEETTLADNQELTCSFIGERTEPGIVDSFIDESSVIIKTAQGENVTKNYDVDTDKSYILVQILIEITTGSAEKVYDGTYLDCKDYSIVGEFVDGDNIEITMSTSIKNVDRVDNEFSYVINYATPTNYEKYKIEMYLGTLTITERPIYYSTGSAEKIYDGTPLVCDDVTIEPLAEFSGVLNGHDMTYEMVSLTNPGTVENKITSFSVKSGEYITTYNYKLVPVDLGTLTVIRIRLKITTHSASKTYDGIELSNYNYTYTCLDGGSIPQGHELKVTFFEKITDVGSVENEATCQVFMGEEDVTLGYDIEYEYGKLEIFAREIYYTSFSDSKRFDGTPLSREGIYIHPTTADTGVLSGHTFTYRTAQLVFPDIIDNAIVYFSVMNGEIDVTHNYKTTPYELGQLEVVPIKTQFITNTDSKLFDGTPLTCKKYKHTSVDGEPIPENHVLQVRVTGTQTAIGQSPNTATSPKVFMNGVDITAGYHIEVVYGNLIVEDPNAEEGGGDSGGGEGNEGSGDNDGEDGDDEGGGGIGGGGFGSSGDIDQQTSKKQMENAKEIPIYLVNSECGGTIYLRNASYGDYSVVNNKTAWLTAPVYNGSDINPLSFPYLAMRYSYQGQTIHVKEIASTAPYAVPYFADLSKDNDLNDTALGHSEKEYEFTFIPWTGAEQQEFTLVGTQYESMEREYREFVKANYLDLPQSTLSEMKSIISEKGFSKSSPSIISDVANFVSGHVPYSFDTYFEGDVAVYFFREAETAICQHYATAATALFRALGIPARYVTGIVGSVAPNVDTIIYAPGHAWVEVYIDGLGWIPVEVTASGGGGDLGLNGGSGSGGSGSEDEEEEEDPAANLPKEFSIKPVDVEVEFTGEGQIVYAQNEITYAGEENIFKKYLNCGYTFNSVVEGSVVGHIGQVTRGESIITEFTMIDNKGFIVYSSEKAPEENKLKITLEPGVIAITPPQIVIELYPVSGDYTGEPLEYLPDDYYVVYMPEFIGEIEFELSGSRIEPGSLNKNEIDLSGFVAYDKDGNKLTKDIDYYVKIEGDTLEVLRMEIEVVSASETFYYDGTEHTANGKDDYRISSGSLCEGHTIEVIITGRIIDIGQAENTIADIIIYDENGQDVTRYYDISPIAGTLTVV